MNIYKSLNTKKRMKSNSVGKSKDIFKLGTPYSKPKKKLSKYGDYDLDGTLNSKDCNPYDPSKDGLFGRLLNVVTFGKAGQSKEDYKREKTFNRDVKEMKANPTFKQRFEKDKEYFKQKAEWKADKGKPVTLKEQVAQSYANYYGRKQKEQLAADEAKRKTARNEKAKAWRKKWVPYADELVEQVKHPLSRKIKQTRHVAITDAKGRAVLDPNTGKPLTEERVSYIRKQAFTDRRSKYGGRTYYGGGLSFHAAKTRLRKDRKTAYGKTLGNVGRPKGTYKPRFIPGVGWRTNVTAQQYYKILRRIKAQQEGQAMATDLTQTQVLARRGIPPQQAQQIINQAQLQRAYYAVPQSQAPEPQQVMQNAQFQSQMAQIQQLEPWARRNAMIRLQRLQQTAQPLPQRVIPRQEVSLMTSRPVFKQQIQTRERWLQ